MYDDHCFMFIILKIKDLLTCEERISGVRFQHLGQKIFYEYLLEDEQDLSIGGDVDGVFWYTKHVHYTLVWI
jgi:hypothetical protein